MEECWVPRKGDEPFARGTLLHRADSCRVQLQSGETVDVRPEDIFPANPENTAPADCCELIHLSEATLLANLRARYAQNAIYTFTGSILLALNPFAELPLYGESKMTRFKGTAPGAEPPHAYAMAEAAYAALLRRGTSQSLVVSGESGAGKTETNKHLTRYLSYRSRGGSDTMNDLSASLLRAGPVLEAMGNAKTVRKRVEVWRTHEREVLAAGVATKRPVVAELLAQVVDEDEEHVLHGHELR